MSHEFAHDEWITEYFAELRSNATVRTSSMSWVHGPILFVVDADEEAGISEPLGLRLDIHEGDVRGVRAAAANEWALTPTAFAGSLARWKSLFAAAITFDAAVLGSQLRFRGDLPTVRRHDNLFAALAATAQSIDTQWQDETADEAVAAGK